MAMQSSQKAATNTPWGQGWCGDPWSEGDPWSPADPWRKGDKWDGGNSGSGGNAWNGGSHGGNPGKQRGVQTEVPRQRPLPRHKWRTSLRWENKLGAIIWHINMGDFN